MAKETLGLTTTEHNARNLYTELEQAIEESPLSTEDREQVSETLEFAFDHLDAVLRALGLHD